MSKLRVDTLESLSTGKQIPVDDLGTAVYLTLGDVSQDSHLKVGGAVRTLGYYSPGDGGGNDYEIVAAGTGADDGGSIIDLHGSGLQAKGLFPEGIYIEQFGCNDSADSTAGLQSAIDYAISLRTLYTLNGNENSIDVKAKGTIDVRNKIVVPRTSNGDVVTGINILLKGVIVPAWNGAANDPVFTFNNPKSTFQLILDCGDSGAAGVFMDSAYDQVYDQIEIYRFSGYGLKYTGKTGNTVFQNPTIQQYRPEHTNFPNFTAPCVVVEGGDCRFEGGNIAWGDVPLYIEEGSYNNLFIGTHIWTGGRVTSPTIEATIIENHTNNGVWFHDCYLDNGHVDCFKDGIHFSGGLFVNDRSVATVTNPILRYYGDGGAQPFFTSQENWIGMFGGVGAFQNPGTLEEFLGDWSVINSYSPEAGSSSNVFNSRRVVFPHDVLDDCDHIQTPGGGYRKKYDIGATQAIEEVLSDGSFRRKAADGGVHRFTSISGNTPHRLKLGGGSTGISENAAGDLAFECGNGAEWTIIGSGGRLRPTVDNSNALGGPAFRVSEIFAASGSINTSDKNEKQQISDLTDAELRVGAKLKVRRYKFNDAVEMKGDGARWHFGFIAQEVIEAFESEGLDAFDYGAVCYDEWDEVPEVRDHDGSVVQAYRAAGSLYGVRHDELYALMMAAR